MGSFIAALRKANGMTQRQLAEKLSVSDKAVSRWERDESYPDLTLIPVIAEIFGVTSDELLRGQRNHPDAPVTPSAEERTEQQRKHLLKSAKLRYQTQSLLCFGIGLLGAFGALICNFAFFRSYLGFGIGAALLLISGLLLAVFTMQAWSAADDKDCEPEQLQEYRTGVFDICRHSVTALVLLLAAILPLVFSGDPYWGILFPDWLIIAAFFCAAAFFVCFIVGQLIICRMTAGSDLPQDKSRRQRASAKLGTVGKILVVILVIALLQGLANSLLSPALLKGNVFDNWDDFKKFVETEDYRDFYVDGNTMVTILLPEDEIPEEEQYITEYLCDSKGNLLCEYTLRNQTVCHMQFADTDNRLPVTVYTYEHLAQRDSAMNRINSAFIVLYAAGFAFCIIGYLKKYRKTAKV